MTDKNIINDFYNLIVKNIREHELNINSNKVTSDSFFIGETATDSQLKYNITTDIKMIQSDLIYSTGMLYALRPHINNPTKETKFFMGKQKAMYFQNMYDSLYSMYASICYEKLYNFWDRIGDKIANEFPDVFPDSKKIMFAFVMDKIKNTTLDKHIKWLSNFRNSDFKHFNNRRREIVHYVQFETKFKEQVHKNINNLDKINEIWIEKTTLPDYFKKHIELTNKGIINTYAFVKGNKKQ